MRPTRRVESGAFPPPTNGRVTPPWSRGGGIHLLSLNGYDGGRAHIVVAILACPPPPSAFFIPVTRVSALRVSLSSGTFSPRSPPPRHPVLPISPPNPALSTYRMLRHSGEIYGYFAKWLNALPDYRVEGGGSGARRRRRPDRDIGYGIVEFHRRIPPAWRARFVVSLRSRIPVAYSALNACLPDSRAVQISDVSLERRLILTTVQLSLRFPPRSMFEKKQKESSVLLGGIRTW